jgi:hypothetical protein
MFEEELSVLLVKMHAVAVLAHLTLTSLKHLLNTDRVQEEKINQISCRQLSQIFSWELNVCLL